MAGLSDISGGRSNYGMPDNGNRKLFDDLAARAMQVQTQEIPAQPMGMMAPPVMQDSPYAQYAYRAIPNPFGGLGVQPLTGFPSAYPLVLNGVPDSFMRWIPTLQSMMPPMQPLQWPQQKQQGTQKAAGAARPRGISIGSVPPVNPNINADFIYGPPSPYTEADYLAAIPADFRITPQQVEPAAPAYDSDYSGMINLLPNVWDWLNNKNPDLVTPE